MAITGGSFKQISPSDIKTRKTSLNQLVDIIQEDVSGSVTRRSYQVFVTGGIGPGVTSSLYQTIYDQNFTLQTANPIMDMTVGIHKDTPSEQTSVENPDSATKLLFPSQTLMMREKIDIYRQHASWLLGDASKKFSAPFGGSSATDINYALFIDMKRLFTRDGIKKNTFACKLFRSGNAAEQAEDGALSAEGQANLYVLSTSGSTIFADKPAVTTDWQQGPVGDIKNTANANEPSVGLIFYDKGAIVLDLEKVFSGSQKMSGTIAGMYPANTINGVSFEAGSTVLGSSAGNTTAKFIPDFLVSGSMDDIIDHIAGTRFGGDALTAMTFQNRTEINSTLIFCRATADEFNYSSNPTFTDDQGNIVVVDGEESLQRSFTFPTTVGLHDEYGNTLAVAKMSRPIEKNDEKDITFRIRLDF